MRYDIWTTDQDLSESSFTDVYLLSGSKKFIHEAVWNLNRDDVIVKLIVDNEEFFYFNLEELSKDFKFDTNKHEAGFTFGIQEYDNDRWVYKPSHPIEIVDHFKIQMKATKNNATLYRGITGWRKR